MSAPPMRGFVIAASWMGGGSKFSTDTRPIVGVVTRRRDTYSRPKPNNEAPMVLRRGHGSEQTMLKEGFTFEDSSTNILPTVLMSHYDRGDLIVIFDPDPRRPTDIGRVMYCRWPEAEDEKRLQDQMERVLEEMGKVKSAVT